MIITLIYRAIVLAILAFIVMNIFDEKKVVWQINAALVIIPLILRVLMIK